MSAAVRLAGAASPGNRRRPQVTIVQVRRQDRRRPRPAPIGGALARLKLHAPKGARAVSRGGGGGNASPLPDRTSETPTDHFEREPLWSSKEEFNAQTSTSRSSTFI